MKRPYFIGFEDKTLGKYLFLGQVNTSTEGEVVSNVAWFSDFQSAKAHSKPEIKKSLPAIKRVCKDKKLKVIKIDVKPL
jgi:hypothetical protein